MDSFGSTALTAISFSNAVPAPPERRGDPRTLSVLRVGKIMTGGKEELCLIRNISAGGLMAHVYSGFAPSEAVAIEIRNGHALTGRIAWYEDGMAGIAFDRRIDVLAFLADEQDEQTQGMVARAPRLKLSLAIILRHGADYLSARLTDISQGGAKLTPTPPTLSFDQDVVLTIPGLSPVAGTMRWRNGAGTGIGFHKLIPFDTLAQWASARQPGR